MTVHLGNIWTWGEEITPEVVQQIAFGVKAHGYETPGAYGIFSLPDSFIYNICQFLEKTKKKFTDDELENFIPDEQQHREEAMDMIRHVLVYLKIFPMPSMPQEDYVELEDMP